MLPLLNFLKCGTRSLQNAALVVAIIDVLLTSILLILFVLGSSLMLAFEIVGKSNNASRVLDIVTDDLFGQLQTSYDKIRDKKDVAEDMGVWLILLFLTIVDFIISCIFLDGVKSKDANKCQVWLNIRIVIIVVFKIVVLINLVYGTSLIHAIPDLIFTIYRVIGLYIGYTFLREIRNPPKLFDGEDMTNNDNEDKKDCDKGNDSFAICLPAINILPDPSSNHHYYGNNANIEDQPQRLDSVSSSSSGITMLALPSTSKVPSTSNGEANHGFKMEEISLKQ